MSGISKAVYLAWNRARLSGKVSFQAELNRGKNILVRLAEKPPYTVFSLPIAGALSKGRGKRRVTVISPSGIEALCGGLEFNKRIELTGTPSHGSKPFKLLKEKLSEDSFDLFVDLDPCPLPEVAVLSGANLRVTFRRQGLFPYFNVLLDPPEECSLDERSTLMMRYLAGKPELKNSLATPPATQKKANRWLRKKGHHSVKKTDYLISSVPLGTESIDERKVFARESWENAEAKTKASLFASAIAYVGKPDRGFELAYLMEVPSVIIDDARTTLPPLPRSPLIKVVRMEKGQSLSPELIKNALAELRL